MQPVRDDALVGPAKAGGQRQQQRGKGDALPLGQLLALAVVEQGDAAAAPCEPGLAEDHDVARVRVGLEELRKDFFFFFFFEKERKNKVV